jgi:hypothetical protein
MVWKILLLLWVSHLKLQWKLQRALYLIQNRFVDFQAFTRQSVVPKITPVRIIVVELASHFNKGYSPTIEV